MKGTRLRYKLSALLLAAFLVFGLTACSGSDAEDRKMDNAKDTTQESTDNKSDNSEDSENSKKTKKKNNSSDDGSEDSTDKKGKKNKDADTDGNSGKDNTDKKTEKKAEKKNSDNSDKKAGKKNADKSDKSNSASKDSTGTGDTSELDIDNLFSDRDLNQTPDLSEAITIKVTDGATIDITESGTYLISGTAKNCTIRVDAKEKDKVQLVLDNVSITNEDFPAVYVVSADKCFITSTGSSTLSVTGEFRADGTTNTDAVIFSKDDIVFNGTGSLSVISAKGNGIAGKDDIKVTGGTYTIESNLDSIEANNSISIKDGTFTIKTGKDGLHSEDSEDNTAGYIYIGGGRFKIDAKSDGIQGTTFVRIDGGTIKITGSEAIEGTYIVINDGTLDLYGSDDGINASRKSKTYSTPTIVVNGGYLKVEVGRGDTDALDANGDIYVNGGTIDVTANGMSSFDYDNKAEFNGGTIIINGEEVDQIPQSMFGPGGNGGWGRPGGQDDNGGFPGGNFPGGNFPDGNFPDGSVFPGGNFPGGNFPGGNGNNSDKQPTDNDDSSSEENKSPSFQA